MDMYLVKGRPDRISHLQRPRICLTERETDTESTSIDIQSVINQYQSISNGNHDNAIINKRNIFKRVNANAEYYESMSIRNPSLTYFPSLVQGVPTELKRNKQRKREAVASLKKQ